MEDGKYTKARIATHRKHAAEALKRCPLCGAINARTNGECYVCLWHGTFDHDPARVEAGLEELLVVCPELADALIETPTEEMVRIQPNASFLSKFWAYFKSRTRLRAIAIRRVFGIV